MDNESGARGPETDMDDCDGRITSAHWDKDHLLVEDPVPEDETTTGTPTMRTRGDPSNRNQDQGGTQGRDCYG